MLDTSYSLEDTPSNQSNKITFRKGEKARIHFNYLNDQGKVKVVPFTFFPYNQSLKLGSFLVPMDEESKSHPKYQETIDAATRIMGEPKTRFATIVLQYACDTSGKPFIPLSIDVKVLKLDSSKVSALQTINSEFPVANSDLLVSCDDEKFQTVGFSATSKSYYPDWVNEIKKSGSSENLQKLRVIEDKMALVESNMHSEYGRRLSIDQIRDILELDKDVVSAGTSEVAPVKRVNLDDDIDGASLV